MEEEIEGSGTPGYFDPNSVDYGTVPIDIGGDPVGEFWWFKTFMELYETFMADIEGQDADDMDRVERMEAAERWIRAVSEYQQGNITAEELAAVDVDALEEMDGWSDYYSDVFGGDVPEPTDDTPEEEVTEESVVQEYYEVFGEQLVDDVVDKVKDLWDKTGEAIDDPVGALNEVLKNLLPAARDCESWTDPCTTASGGGTVAGGGNPCWKDCVSLGIILGIPNIPLPPAFVSKTVRELEDALKEIGKDIDDFLENPTQILDDIKEAVESVGQTIEDFINDPADVIGKIIDDIKDQIKDIFDPGTDPQGIYDWMKGILGDLVSGVVWNEIQDNIDGIFIDDPTDPEEEPEDPTEVGGVEVYDCEGEAGRAQTANAQKADDCGECINQTEDGRPYEINPNTGFCEPPEDLQDPVLTEEEQECKDSGRKFENGVCLEECENPDYVIDPVDGDCRPKTDEESADCPPPSEYSEREGQCLCPDGRPLNAQGNCDRTEEEETEDGEEGTEDPEDTGDPEDTAYQCDGNPQDAIQEAICSQDPNYVQCPAGNENVGKWVLASEAETACGPPRPTDDTVVSDDDTVDDTDDDLAYQCDGNPQNAAEEAICADDPNFVQCPKGSANADKFVPADKAETMCGPTQGPVDDDDVDDDDVDDDDVGYQCDGYPQDTSQAMQCIEDGWTLCPQDALQNAGVWVSPTENYDEVCGFTTTVVDPDPTDPTGGTEDEDEDDPTDPTGGTEDEDEDDPLDPTGGTEDEDEDDPLDPVGGTEDEDEDDPLDPLGGAEDEDEDDPLGGAEDEDDDTDVPGGDEEEDDDTDVPGGDDEDPPGGGLGRNMFKPQGVGPLGQGDPALLARQEFPIVDFLSEILAKQTKDDLMTGMFTGNIV